RRTSPGSARWPSESRRSSAADCARSGADRIRNPRRARPFGAAILPDAGGALRSRPPPPAPTVARLRCPVRSRVSTAGDRVTSNVGQNYPYTSESASERAAAIERLVAEREGLAAPLAAETPPPDANDRWWVWKCPTKGCPGLLHVAGYALDKHALFVVCDGTCGKTFLR